MSIKRPVRARKPNSICDTCPNKSHQSARLVGLGFRLWLTGLRTSDLSHWEKAWRLYENVLGPSSAQVATTELSYWVRALSTSATRDIEVLPAACEGFCRDECLAVAMIAASQHKTCPAMRACAFALIENSCLQNVIDRSESFATTLRAVDQVLSPNYIVSAPITVPPTASGYLQ